MQADLTVKALKKFIANLPDEAVVRVVRTSIAEGNEQVLEVRSGEVERLECEIYICEGPSYADGA